MGGLSAATINFIVLTTALVLYGLIWYATRNLSRFAQVLARLSPVGLVIPMLLYVSVVTSKLAPTEVRKPTAEPTETMSKTSGEREAEIERQASAELVQTDWDVVPVFYGTDRDRDDAPKRIGYGSKRAKRLELGHVLVTVPKLHQVPKIERPFAIRIPFTRITIFERAEDPKYHFTIQEIGALSQEQFIERMRERVGKSSAFKDQAVIFVHGYNNDFDYAIYRTAQMAYDLQFDGAAFLYSWPSGSGLTGYNYDRDSANQAELYLNQFIKLVLNESKARSVSIIAHSMGNQPLLNVLRDIGPQLPEGVQLNQIIMASPDVDRDVFANVANNIKKYARGFTLYCSSNDRAMAAARRVAGGIPRAGDVPPDGPVLLEGIDTIDVSETSTDYLALNHSLYAERSALLSDIGLLLQTGERPPEVRTPILQRMTSPKGTFWRYP